MKWTFPSESSGIFILPDHHDKDDDADAEEVDEKNDY